MKKPPTCRNCYVFGHNQRKCPRPIGIITKEDVDCAIKTFYKVKEKMEKEVLIYKKSPHS